MLAPNQYSVGVAQSPSGQSGQPAANNNGGTNDAFGLVRTLLRQSNGAVEYDPVYNNIYEDKTLATFQQENGNNSEETMAYFKQHASQYIFRFLEQAKIARYGYYHNVYKDVIENYASINNPVPSQVKAEFSKVLLSRIDLLDKVTVRVGVWFGHVMVGILKESNGNSPHQGKVIEAIRNSTLNILNLEIVLWLNGSRKAEGFLYNPTPEILSLQSKFNLRKEAASRVFQFFEDQSPYDAANFGVTENNHEGNYSMIMPEFGDTVRQRITPNKDAGYYDHTGNFGKVMDHISDQDRRELMMIPFENLRNAPRAVDLDQPRRVQSMDMEQTYGEDRDDLFNINISNRNQFNIRRYFKRTCVPGWYMVSEHEWRYLRLVLKRHPSQRAEINVLGPDCRRFVNINLTNESESEGWRSTAITFDDQQEEEMLLSDPGKLLPALLGENEQYSSATPNVSNLSEALGKRTKLAGWDDKFEEEMREEGYQHKVMKVEETFVSGETSKVVERLVTSSHDVSMDFARPMAIIGEVVVTGRRFFETEEKRALIARRYPELFKGYESERPISYFSMIESIANRLKHSPVDEEGTERNDRFDLFLISRLTIDLNNWFINSCGYECDPNDPNKLSVDNIIEDWKELKEYLYHSDKPTFDKLNDKGQILTLLKHMQLFEPITEAPEGMSVLDKTEFDLSLQRSRVISTVTVCNELGPKIPKNKLLVLKRSISPEFFVLLDTLKKEIEIKGREPDEETILFYYRESGLLYMVSPVIYDENVVTLRTVSTVQTLLNPMFK